MLLHRQPDLTVIMDNVNKAHNLSAIIRSCDGVGINELHAVSYRKSIYTEQNAAAGASKWLTLKLHSDMAAACRTVEECGMQILVATGKEGALDFREVDYTLPTAIVVGAEWNGLSEEAIKRADHAITVPMLGMVESLNVSVATAVMLFEAQRQRAAKGMYNETRLNPECFQRLLFEYTHPRLSRELRQEGSPYPHLDAQGAICTLQGSESVL